MSRADRNPWLAKMNFTMRDAHFIFQGFGLVMYVYIFEMFPGRYRESIGVFGGFWWTINVMTITVFGYGLRNYSWRYLHLATGLIGAIGLGTYW